MKEKINLRNIRNALVCCLIVAVIPLFILNGQIWVLNWFIVWNIIVTILFVILMNYLFKRSKKKPKTKQQSKIIIIIGILYLIAAPFILAFFSFPLASYPVKYVRAEFNKGECERIVNEIIAGCHNDTEKTLALLNWFERFSGNMYNTYGSVEVGPLYFGGGVIFDYMLCVRLDDRKPVLWTLTSRCGACGEHAALFTAMATQAGLEARTIVCDEVDHAWAEVKINGTWLIMEPANVVHNRNMTGYDISATSFERVHAHRTKNLSYIIAENPDGTIDDITYRYTNLTQINITTINEDGDPLPDIELSITSYNRYPNGADTKYKGKTNEKGQYQMLIGGGDLKLVAQSSDIIPLYAENRSYFLDDSSTNVVLILHQDWTKNIYLVVSLLIFGLVMIFISIVYLG
ncbi:MAG: hypothetical protein DRN24_05600, partial [Thermoplasmata archaeon]